MSAAKKGLGRGFESLIPTDLLDETFDPTVQQDKQVSELRHLALHQVTPDPDQPRRYFDEIALQELAASIDQHGILQPIVVVVKGEGYQIVAGERRYRAASMLGMDTIPALVRTLSNQHQLELSLIENLQRADLNSIETATAYMKLRDQFNLTLEEIGKRVGNKSTSAVSNTLRLLKLPKAVQHAIAQGKLTEGQARPLVGQDDAFVEEILPRIIAEDWSARKVEQFMVNKKSDHTVKPEKVVPEVDPRLLDRWQKRLSTEVTIRTNSKGAGQVVIKFKNPDELERIEKLLGA
jgi:ParB family transcriptional regulator, chromosome partitioning protein